MIKVNENECEILGTGEQIVNDIGNILTALERGDLLTNKESKLLFKLTSKIIIKNILKGE